MPIFPLSGVKTKDETMDQANRAFAGGWHACRMQCNLDERLRTISTTDATTFFYAMVGRRSNLHRIRHSDTLLYDMRSERTEGDSAARTSLRIDRYRTTYMRGTGVQRVSLHALFRHVSDRPDRRFAAYARARAGRNAYLYECRLADLGMQGLRQRNGTHRDSCTRACVSRRRLRAVRPSCYARIAICALYRRV